MVYIYKRRLKGMIMCGMGITMLAGAVLGACLRGPSDYMTWCALAGCALMFIGTLRQHQNFRRSVESRDKDGAD
jgi:hypothetical protein